MNIRNAFLTLMLLACAAIAPKISHADVDVFINVPPPPVRVETVPAPRHGYVWVPGYWDVKHNHHVWRKGHWERERVGYYYAPPMWVERAGRWELQRGRWNKGDADRDGVPNRFDDAPHNPRRH